MEWRPVPSYPGYEVSDAGEARYEGKELRITHKAYGRRRRYFVARNMRLTNGKMATGCRTQVFVGTAVLEAFQGKPEGAREVWYINGDCCDDRLENLIWVKPSEFKKLRKAESK